MSRELDSDDELLEGWDERDYDRRFPPRRRHSRGERWARMLALCGTLYSDAKISVFTEQIRSAVARRIGIAPRLPSEPMPRGPIAPLPTVGSNRPGEEEFPRGDEREFFACLNASERRAAEVELEERFYRLELYAGDELRQLRADLPEPEQVERFVGVPPRTFLHCGAPVRFLQKLPYCPRCGNTGAGLSRKDEANAA